MGASQSSEPSDPHVLKAEAASNEDELARRRWGIAAQVAFVVSIGLFVVAVSIRNIGIGAAAFQLLVVVGLCAEQSRSERPTRRVAASAIAFTIWLALFFALPMFSRDLGIPGYVMFAGISVLLAGLWIWIRIKRMPLRWWGHVVLLGGAAWCAFVAFIAK